MATQQNVSTDQSDYTAYHVCVICHVTSIGDHLTAVISTSINNYVQHQEHTLC